MLPDAPSLSLVSFTDEPLNEGSRDSSYKTALLPPFPYFPPLFTSGASTTTTTSEEIVNTIRPVEIETDSVVDGGETTGRVFFFLSLAGPRLLI